MNERYISYLKLFSLALVCMMLASFSHASAIDTKQADQLNTGCTSSGSKYYVAYYFYGNKRCSTCKKLETYSSEALNSEKIKEASALPIFWKTINVENPENSHFTDDFDLYTQSLVITEYSGDSITRWKNLEEIWILVKNKPDFIEYVIEEVCSFLKE